MLPPLCTIPVYIPRSDGAFRHHGSAITLMFKERYYLATAAHVVDGDGLTKNLLICTSKSSSVLVPLSSQSICTLMPPSGRRVDDPCDLAVIPLIEHEARNLATMGLHFIGCDDAVSAEVRVGDELKFIGYPELPQKFCHLANGSWIEQQPVSIRVFQTSEAEADTLGYSLRTHLVGRFRHPESKKARDESADILVPEGMSGGVVWHCSTDCMVFAGIVTKWNQQGHLIATRSHLLQPMLKEMRSRGS